MSNHYVLLVVAEEGNAMLLKVFHGLVEIWCLEKVGSQSPFVFEGFRFLSIERGG